MALIMVNRKNLFIFILFTHSNCIHIWIHRHFHARHFRAGHFRARPHPYLDILRASVARENVVHGSVGAKMSARKFHARKCRVTHI